MRKQVLYPTAFLVLTASILMSVFLPLPVPEVQEVWQGYIPVLVENDGTDAADEIESYLFSLGWNDLISKNTQKVRIFTYTGELEVAYEQLNEYILSVDRRYDDYLSGIDGYFEGRIDGKEALVLYLPAAEKTADRWNRTVEMLESLNKNYYIPQTDVGENSYFWLLFCINIAVLCFIIPRKGRLLFLFGAAVVLFGWRQMQFPIYIMMSIQAGGWAFFSVWAGVAFTRHFNIGYSFLRKDLIQRTLLYVLFLGIGFVLVVSSGMFESALPLVLRTINTFLGHAALALLYSMTTQKRVARQNHTLFFPVPMRNGRGKTSSITVKYSIVIVTAVVLPLIVQNTFYTTSVENVGYPQPISVIANQTGFDWAATAQFMSEKGMVTDSSGSVYLPDISDYITHRAYQEGYMYGRPYRFPAEGEQIAVKVYEKQGLKIFGKDKVFKMFTEKWYKDIITDASNNGVSRLLHAQKGPVLAASRKTNTFRIPTHTVLGFISVFALMIPLVYFFVSVKMNRQYYIFEKNQHRKGQKVA